MVSPTYYDENITKFVEWLQTGMKRYADNAKN